MNSEESPAPAPAPAPEPEQKAPVLAGDEMVISQANPVPESQPEEKEK
jgi:hypothetical protein